MNLLYLTADRIGATTGGGLVTAHELTALKTLGPCQVISRDELGQQQDPWGWDEEAFKKRDWFINPPKLCHVYSGTFSKTIATLKQNGCKVVVTIAAHDREVSKREHEALGMEFPYLHLVREDLWQRYIAGYAAADVIVCPSSVAANTVRKYGPEFEKKRIEVIPHGCTLPKTVAPLPNRFVCGYLGAAGADKGLRYLFEAWKKLDYKDATLLIAGRDSLSPFMTHLLSVYGGGNVHLGGWQENVSDFYNRISVFVCPSATEGFNIEVLEAMAHGRPVICSLGAGASDLVPFLGNLCRPCTAEGIMSQIEWIREELKSGEVAEDYRVVAEQSTWDRVRSQYIQLWKELLHG